jgi:DNA-binding transcriptional MerR regulator
MTVYRGQLGDLLPPGVPGPVRAVQQVHRRAVPGRDPVLSDAVHPGGVVGDSGKRAHAGYRVYGDTAPQALRIIEQAQLAGFTLAEIKALLPEAGAGAWNRAAVLDALHRRLAALEEMERQLARSKRKLQAAIRDVEGNPVDVSCAENADRIIDRLGSLSG